MDSRIQRGALRPTGSEHEWGDERRRPTNGVARYYQAKLRNMTF